MTTIPFGSTTPHKLAKRKERRKNYKSVRGDNPHSRLMEAYQIVQNALLDDDVALSQFDYIMEQIHTKDRQLNLLNNSYNRLGFAFSALKRKMRSK